MRKEVIGNAELWLGDCLEILPTLPKVDAVITSPPYAEQRDYGGGLAPWDSTMQGAFSSLPASDACQILVNLGLVHKGGECRPYWEAWREWMRSIGWRFFGWYVWDQGSGLPGNWNGRLAPSHEFVLHFNRCPIAPAKWVPCTSQSSMNGGGLRGKDGVYSKQKRNLETQQTKVADSVIRVNRASQSGDRFIDHPAIFPVAFAKELAMSFTSLSQYVLDPFMGSGTTGVACMNLGRKFIGIEIEPKYFDIACRRIDDAQRQARLFA